MTIEERSNEYYNVMYKDFPDVVIPAQLKMMLGNIGKNKIYTLLKENKIKNTKIGKNYIIAKISVIEYLMQL